MRVRCCELGIGIAMLCLTTPQVSVSENVIHTKSDKVVILYDGGKAQERKVNMSSSPEQLVTTAYVLTFQSDLDTLSINLNEWENTSLKIINDRGESAYIKVSRRAINPYENPSPDILAMTTPGLLSRAQAEFDIDALVNAISNVHPDMFFQCRHVDFFNAVNDLKQSLPDSVSSTQLYLRLTPVVAMLGDGHTHLLLPDDKVLKDEEIFMPVYLRVSPDKSLRTVWSKCQSIPQGAQIISINGLSADSIISSLMHLVSGERDAFRLMRVDYDFTALYHLMYPAEEYAITYCFQDGEKRMTDKAVLISEPWMKIKRHFQEENRAETEAPYTFTIDKSNNVALMDFRSFEDQGRMEHFADSMFRELRHNNIDNLIIDLRENGGGNSLVGDVLLRYMSPEPFIQMDKVLTRITPLTARLLNARNVPAMMQLYETPESEYIPPLTEEEGFYRGNIFLLTSSKTFSSAASFTWTFSECNIGTIIGEETGGLNVSFGDKVRYTLPVSGLECGISFKRFWQFRADESDIHGALPNVYVPSSEALSKALSIINDN